MTIEIGNRSYFLDKVCKKIELIEIATATRRSKIIEDYNNHWFHKLFGIKFNNYLDLSLEDSFSCIQPLNYDCLILLKHALASKQTGRITLTDEEYDWIK